MNNDKDKINELLLNDIIDTTDEGGRTALHLAAAYCCSDIVQILLDHNANVSIADDIFSWSPLRYADRCHYWNIGVDGSTPANVYLNRMKYLIKNGVDFTIVNIIARLH